MTTKHSKHLRSGLVAALVAGSVMVTATGSRAADLNLAPLPLFLGGMIDPNIMVTFDDSGSMFWSYMPDTIGSLQSNKRGLAASVNSVAYNPAFNYKIPPGPDGTQLPAPPFNAAWDDGYKHYAYTRGWVGSDTCTLDLGTNYRPTWHYAAYYTTPADNCDGTDYSDGSLREYHQFDTVRQAAYYYVFDSTSANPTYANCDGTAGDDDCYRKVVVSSTSGINGSDELQNFANWYSYYRRRAFTAKAGIASAFSTLGSTSRVGFARINKGSSPVDGASTDTVERGIRSFSDLGSGQNYRSEFYKLLFLAPTNGSTPTREAARDVGRYFDGAVSGREASNTLSPWDNTPGVDDTAKALTCRSAYHVLTSDGYWNSDSVSVGNVDGDNGAPFADGYSNTLADVAMHYYERDLQTGLENNVPVNREDKATWQHLVTYAVGLGVQGLTIDPTTAFNAIASGATINWPDPQTYNPNTTTVTARIDDLLHAAVNSRGGFAAAQNPQDFAEALRTFVTNINQRSGSAAAVVLNSGALNDETRVYQAKFDTSNWTGQLLAYNICDGTNTDPGCTGGETGTLGDLAWDAATKIPAAGARRIVSFNGTKGVPFRWAQTPDANTLTCAQEAAIDSVAAGGATCTGTAASSDVLNYLRGDASKEKRNGGTLRNRASLLGDIINSAPAYMGPPTAPYFDYWGDTAPESVVGKEYSAYRLSKLTRDPIIFVGANDGMLHAFDAGTGVERFAYIPAKVVSNLKNLADPNYAHVNFVDGSPTVGDAFYGSAWHTVVVSGLQGGGQGIFAIDVTDPGDWSSEGTGATKVLWEFTDANDADLGYTYSRPNIVRLNNDKWAAVFGNGYNNTVADGTASTTGDAVLYVVDIQTGALIKKISTEKGRSADPTGQSRPNGLATVSPVDVDGDFIVDYVYGGDLFGNLWKFDLNDIDPTKWGSGYKSGNKPAPLFVAVASNGIVQPITVRPQVMFHPTGASGTIVLFGTGKYMEVGDNSGNAYCDGSSTDPDCQPTQTFYAIWDDGNNGRTRSNLLQQKILAEETVTTNGVSYDYRITSDYAINWGSGGQKGWYLDLLNTEGNNTKNYGERQVSDSILRNGRIIFTSLLPLGDDPCKFGGDGWLMELDAASGARLTASVFDVNRDGVFTSADYVDADGSSGNTFTPAPVSGVKSKEGIVPMPAILSREGGGKEYKYLAGSTGNIEVVTENPGLGDFGRQSWQQLLK